MSLRFLCVPLALALLLAARSGAEERHTVAVLPLVVHALDQQAYLREGLADMLSSRLGQQSGIAVVRVPDSARATIDPAAARATAQAVGAQWVVFGSFTRFGEGASLDLLCLDVAAPGEPGPRAIFVQSGQLSDLIPRLDGVAARVAAHVRGQELPAAAPGAGGPGRAELDELRQRVEALERRATTAPPPRGEAP